MVSCAVSASWCSFVGFESHVLCACHMTGVHDLVCGCGLCHMSVLTCMSLQLLVGEY